MDQSTKAELLINLRCLLEDFKLLKSGAWDGDNPIASIANVQDCIDMVIGISANYGKKFTNNSPPTFMTVTKVDGGIEIDFPGDIQFVDIPNAAVGMLGERIMNVTAYSDKANPYKKAEAPEKTVVTEFECHGIHTPDLPVLGCLKQCEECKYHKTSTKVSHE
jgi:hypothetical protein